MLTALLLLTASIVTLFGSLDLVARTKGALEMRYLDTDA